MMTENLYKVPESVLVENTNEVASFYVVSPRKFLILFIATFGLYTLYWFYEHWRQLKTRTKENIWPVPRAIFSIFFTHSLFRRIDKAAKVTGEAFSWSASGMATVYVLSEVVQNVCDRMSAKGFGSPYTDILGVLPIIFVGWSLFRAQKIANIACQDFQGSSNNRITLVNILWIVLGSVFWLLIIVGFYDLFIGIPEFS
ncbi:hypothetical protein [Zooshikella ganghwensis]|uniref:hypothetical protein n=1 Tax=Zooshikella ganghwensis TaxID=202772 RepID=UPI000685515A|nr:hypothetical protein [Zooshikella ganghwensis]